ncbi:hypothetical protein LAZ67_X002193 [Cordylochernes scorpioides]|uniref:Integrase catalytic domain-containing protein n=1 Tax=Cordylochernes scorpioides TaxID=51811 RepID=A0ABY6LU98_9ARAC|nr:hypothetical protein LAZ67_X002193 [Cordylochernes scorpioides]
MNQPPLPCKICASHQLPNQIHFHRDCPLEKNTHPKRINPVSSAELKKLRTPVRARFTKAFNELETEIKKNEVKKADVEKILRRFQTHHEKLSILNMRMEEALLRESASEDIFTAEYESVCEYEDNFCNIMTDYEALAEKDDFSTIDRDPQMPPETKFQYLFQATAENSEVREAVESFPPSADNYPKVIEYIKSRFGEDEMLVDIYVRDLLQNVLQNMRADGKMSVVKLYDRLETQLRALETLGVARDKFAAMLYPLVESALPEDTLRVWERSQYTVSGRGVQDKLTQLMTFLKTEVKGESRVNMAKAAFKIDNNQDAKDDRSNRKSLSKKNTGSKMPTATDLANTTQMRNNCIFCGNGHPSQECYSGQPMHLPEKKDKAKGNNACFWYLLPGHGFKKCRIKPRCPVCGGKHYPIMCPTLEAQKTSHLQKAELKVSGESPATKQETANQFTSTTLNNATVGGVYLQTLIVKISGPKGKHNVRVLLDCGSQRSYISKRMVDALGLKRVQQVTLTHNLFEVQDLWKLDVLGIMDAAETKSRKDLIEASNTHFKENVKRDESGRYIVSLPWIAGHPPVPVNCRTTEHRLLTTTRNVQGKMLYEKYDTIFEEWEKEKFIEEVEDKWEECSYLPHRPVLKDSHTTPIRPVFDASCKKKGLPSLNQCLEKGDNLIELIPDLLLRFRLGKYGIIADIRKAFLQIQVREEDQESPEKIQCWTDSSPALYWIQQQENWAQFVSNRVNEITTLTKSEDWNHVAGEHNPADLPSRGESPSKFTKSGWWEGPKWLQEKKEDWPVSKVQYDLEAIEEERRKTVVAGFVAKKPEENPWYLNLYEGKREVTLTQILRVIAWMLRFKPSEYQGNIISQEELDSAEKSLVKIIQSESIGEEDPKLKQLHAFQDKEGLWRVKTRIKVWFVIFTCGVYRAVHLELVTSLSTEALVGAVERFVARRGCPAVIYSDNGTNLVGLRNELYRVNFGVKWKLNPPAEPWWGGWIERIVGLTKELLRRLLGKCIVNYEEMVTILENCERVINARPLTYISEDNDDLVPLTPEIFLREPRAEGEIDLNEFRCNFGKSYEKRKRLLKEFRKRFRSEYLGLLVHHDNHAMRGLVVPRNEEVIITPIDISCATSTFFHRLEQADKINREILATPRQPALTMSHVNHRKK